MYVLWYWIRWYLQSSAELEAVSKRLGRLVYGEFNLFAEGEALDSFAMTSIGCVPTLCAVHLRARALSLSLSRAFFVAVS